MKGASATVRSDSSKAVDKELTSGSRSPQNARPRIAQADSKRAKGGHGDINRGRLNREAASSQNLEGSKRSPELGVEADGRATPATGSDNDADARVKFSREDEEIAEVVPVSSSSSEDERAETDQELKIRVQASYGKKGQVKKVLTWSKDLQQKTDGNGQPVRRGSTANNALQALRFDRFFIENMLMHWSLFANCCPDFVGELASHVQSLHIDGGATIAQRGSKGSALIFVLRGILEVFIRDLKVCEITAGGFIGETLFLGVESHWTVTVKAAPSVTGVICSVNRDDLMKVSKRFQDMTKWTHDVLLAGKGYVPGQTLATVVDLFNGLSAECLATIGSEAFPRMYFPGDKIIREGECGDELVILMKGDVELEIVGHVVREISVGASKKPVCFGELGLLGMQKTRSATVIALSICLVRIVYRPVFLLELKERGESLKFDKIGQFMEDRYEGKQGCLKMKDTIASVKIFQEAGCSQEFLDFLAAHLEGSVYLAHQVIVDESAKDRCMYFINEGSVNITKDGSTVGTLGSGSCFGEMMLFGLVRGRTATVVANETCYVEVLHQSVISRGLELFADHRDRVVAAAYKKAAVTQPKGLSNRANAIQVVARANFFNGLPAGFLEQISQQAVDRIFMPEEFITIEGMDGNSMFIVLWGTAGVFLGGHGDETGSMKKLKEMHAGSVFGELAMLGVSKKRSATIKAETLCAMWEVSEVLARKLFKEFPEASSKFVPIITENLTSTVPERILSLPMFSGFDRNFRIMLALECKCRVYFPDQCIVHMGQPGSGLFVINIGEAMLHRNGIKIASLSAGSHFGALLMLGLTRKAPCTMEAVFVCHLLVITRESYVRALTMYPSAESHENLKRDEMKAGDEMATTMRRVMSQSAMMLQFAETFANICGHVPEGASPAERCAKVFRAWRHHVKERLTRMRARAVKEQRDQNVSKWINYHEHARELRAEKDQAALQQMCLRGMPETQGTSRDKQQSARWDGSVSRSSPAKKGISHLPPLGGAIAPRPCDATERWIPYSARTPRRKNYQYIDDGAPSPVKSYCTEGQAKGQTTQLLFLPFLPVATAAEPSGNV